MQTRCQRRTAATGGATRLPAGHRVRL